LSEQTNAASSPMQAVIIATGRSSGLGLLTRERPKSMLPVLGKPFVIRLMDQLKAAGLRRFIVVVGEHEGELASYLSTTWVPDVSVQMVMHTSGHGTGDALGVAARYIEGPFVLATSDHLVPPLHIKRLYQKRLETQADVVLSAAAGVVPPTFPALRVEGDRVTALQVNAPRQGREWSGFAVMACNRRLLNHTSQTAPDDFEAALALNALLAAGGAIRFMPTEWNISLTRDIDLLTINRRFLGEERDSHILSEIPSTVRIVPPVRIDPRVSIGRGAKLGPNVYIEAGAQVGANAIISNSIVLSSAEIRAEEQIHNQIVTRSGRIAEDLDMQKTRPAKPEGLQDFLDAQDDKDS
jgi:NDP-sugar pyrophosphorylase family protein